VTGVSHLRPMTSEDIAAGLRLCRMSLWNQVEDDWRCFLDWAEAGGRLAENDGAVVGTVAFLRYGHCFSWLSMMLVDPSARHAGIGSRLLEAALDALAEESCVRLDASPAGEALYRRYGFVPEHGLTRARIIVAGEQFRRSPEKMRPIAPSDLAEISAWDQEVFGADRSRLLASFHKRAPELAWAAWEEACGGTATSLLGYCFGRPGYRYGQLGPIVAESQSVARELVSHCLAGQDGQTLVVDAPRLVPEWTEWLESAGFEMERPFLRMQRGENRNPGIPERQFGIAGPEFG
jgi:GNAT superfamily N-acetyltransferase